MLHPCVAGRKTGAFLPRTPAGGGKFFGNFFSFLIRLSNSSVLFSSNGNNTSNDGLTYANTNNDPSNANANIRSQVS